LHGFTFYNGFKNLLEDMKEKDTTYQRSLLKNELAGVKDIFPEINFKHEYHEGCNTHFILVVPGYLNVHPEFEWRAGMIITTWEEVMDTVICFITDESLTELDEATPLLF